jgi:flagellar motor switch protein FliM
MDDEEFSVRIQETITESVNFWLPYISIREINVELTDEQRDKNQAVIKLTFSVNNQFESEEVTFTVGN